jgi:asparagine synthase (glutamine-hydrolysing)
MREMRRELDAAVGRQLMSDVPVGAFLSGGLDSSLLVHFIRAKNPGRLPTYAVGFPAEGVLASELDAAAHAAAVFDTDHHARLLERDAYFDALPEAVWQADEPVAHPGMLLQRDLSTLARQHVKVVLTGQGADEPLGGYVRHQAARAALALGPALRGLGVRRARGSNELLSRLTNLANERDDFGVACAIFGPVRADELGSWVPGLNGRGADAVRGAVAGWWTKGAALDPAARVLYLDSRTSLPEDLLLVGDRMSMWRSLESRVPFLDLEYLRLLESIPGSHRLRLVGSRKHLQYALAHRTLPRALRSRLRGGGLPWVRKRGFDVPVTPWFRRSVGPRLRRFLAGPGAVLPELLNAELADARVASYLHGRGAAYRLPLSLFVLECWLRMHVRGVSHTELPSLWRAQPGAPTSRGVERSWRVTAPAAGS